MENLNKRAVKIFESTETKVASRIEAAARSGAVKYEVAYLDGTPEGVLQFYILHDDFSIASKDEHQSFLNRLLINDEVLHAENAYLVEESGAESYIEVEPRKGLK